jgi:shikimate 5-dehydrogenase
MTGRYCVSGNPIDHGKSPLTHAAPKNQLSQKLIALIGMLRIPYRRLIRF